jgi:hypothetical protein
MAGVLTYDPRKVIVIFGNKQISGFSDDGMVTIAPHGEGMQLYSGADGGVARSIDPDHTFKVTIHLASSSKSNTDLSNVYNADRATGQYIQPLLIKDLGGQTLFSAAQAWVSNFPESTRGRTIATQDWVIQTGNVDAPIIGGNN